MESVQSWITYWYQVLVTCLFWVFEYYPVPTIIVAVLLTGATVIGFFILGQSAEVRNILWGSLFGLVACFVMFLIMVITVGPYLHLQQREKAVTGAAKVEYETMEKSKNDQIKTLNDTVAVLSGSQKTLLEKEQMAKENREKVIAKLCFHSPLAFTQARLENFQTPSTLNFEYAKEILIKPFSFSGPTTVRIHVDGGVSWFHTTPRDKEFERFNGGVAGHDYVEVPISSKVLGEGHWSIKLYGEKPFDVICIDKLQKKPAQAPIPVKTKETTAALLVRKCPVDNPKIGRFPDRFIPYWIALINSVRIDRPKLDLRSSDAENGRIAQGWPFLGRA